MKRYPALVLLIVLLATFLLHTPLTHANMVSNPGFESGTTGWSLKDSFSSIVTASPHSGSKCLKLRNNGASSNHDTVQVVNGVVAGKEYEYSMWVRGENVVGVGTGGKPMGMLTWRTSGGSKLRRWLNLHVKYGSYGWYRMVCRAEAPPTSAKCDVYVRSWYDCTSGSTYWDDFVLEERDFSDRGAVLGTYQAENADTKYHCTTHNDEPDYTGSGFVHPSDNDAYLQWNNVNVGAGTRIFVVRYAQEAQQKTWTLRINGVSKGTRTAYATGAPASWATVAWEVTVPAGGLTVKLEVDKAIVGPFIDKLTVHAKSGGTGPTPPAAPSGLQATVQSSTGIRVTWSDNSNDEDGFKLDRRQSGTTVWVRIATPSANATGHTDTGLAEGTKFYYQVKAYNSGGESAYSNIDDATTDTALLPPAAPSGLTATAVSPSSIDLSWTDNADNEDGFQIERRQSGTTIWVSIGPIAANSSTYRNTDLPVDTKFYYKVKAYNATGTSDPSNVADATTPPAAIAEGFAKGATWRYRIGTAEASAPATAWRMPGFDDSGWAQGAAPLGYGGLSYGTDLETAMKGVCSSLFLRRSFTVAAPAQVTAVALDIDFDDGLIVWINGQEVARVNVAGSAYDPVAHDAVSDGYVSGATENRVITLAGGTLPTLRADNEIAVHLLNAAPGSGDLLADLQLSVSSEPLSVSEDADADGMPDEWEEVELAGLSDPSDLSDLSDPDNDGASNYDEWVAGTGANDAGSFLCVELSLAAGNLTVSFPTIVPSGPGYAGRTRHYQLQRCSSPGTADWQPVPGYEDRVATGSPVSYAAGSPNGALCYRARVWLEE